jgi:hypothetical protein
MMIRFTSAAPTGFWNFGPESFDQVNLSAILALIRERLLAAVEKVGNSTTAARKSLQLDEPVDPNGQAVS